VISHVTEIPQCLRISHQYTVSRSVTNDHNNLLLFSFQLQKDASIMLKTVHHYCLELCDEENVHIFIECFISNTSLSRFRVLWCLYLSELDMWMNFFSFFLFFILWNHVSTNKKTASESPCICFAVVLQPTSALGSLIFRFLDYTRSR
jgi:hypothetical protein